MLTALQLYNPDELKESVGLGIAANVVAMGSKQSLVVSIWYPMSTGRTSNKQ
jgi:hypothetical protein